MQTRLTITAIAHGILAGLMMVLGDIVFRGSSLSVNYLIWPFCYFLCIGSAQKIVRRSPAFQSSFLKTLLISLLVTLTACLIVGFYWIRNNNGEEFTLVNLLYQSLHALPSGLVVGLLLALVYSRPRETF